MSGCTQTGKPLIAILMAIYEPRLDWLREQLESLEKQTYPNLKLYIRDDCSPTVSFEEIQNCVAECIRSFPYEIKCNEKNLGSNGTFERLTREAEGEYFAYCDQDDVWLPEKLERLQREISTQNACLICSDVYIIDANGKVTANSITDIRRRHVFHSGKNLAPYLLVRNFIIGCTMLIRAEIAHSAIPFEPGYVHDQWLGIKAAAEGSIAIVREPLIYYRQHSNNQTGILSGIHSKQDYFKVRIEKSINTLESAIQRLELTPSDQKKVAALRAAMTARKDYFSKPNIKDLKAFLHCGTFSLQSVIFETMLPFLPERVVCALIRFAKSGRV